MTTARERYEDFLKNFLTPFLKLRGFKKKGNKFIFYGDELAHVIYLQRGRYNDHDYVSFFLDLRIYERNFSNKRDASVIFYPLVRYSTNGLDKDPYFYHVELKTGEEWAVNKDKLLRVKYLDNIEIKIFNLKTLMMLFTLYN